MVQTTTTDTVTRNTTTITTTRYHTQVTHTFRLQISDTFPLFIMHTHLLFILVTSIILSMSSEFQHLNILTWNARGAMTSAKCLTNLIDTHNSDIVIISEHKLTQYSYSFLTSVHSNYAVIPNTETINDWRKSLSTVNVPKVAILIKKDIIFSTTEIVGITCDRVIGIKLHSTSTNDLFIFGVYLPADNNLDEFHSCIDVMQDLYDYYSPQGRVIFAGDCNAKCNEKCASYTTKIKSQRFTSFINTNNLIPVNKTNLNDGLKYTYEPMRTTLDYVLAPSHCIGIVTQCKVINSGNSAITSDHYPISCTLKLPTDRYTPINKIPLPAWHKCESGSLISYQLIIDQIICTQNINTPTTKNEIIALNDFLVNTMHHAATAAVPNASFNPHTKPYWSTDVKNAHNLAREKRKMWLIDNQPRGMQYTSYREYKTAKDLFRAALKQSCTNYEHIVFQDIDDAAGLDLRLFWKLVNRQKSKHTNVCYAIKYNGDTKHSPVEIADTFANYFKNLYHCNDSDSNDFEVNYSDQSNIASNVEFEIDEVMKAISTLKSRKAPGIDNIQNEHLKFGGRKLHIAIQQLYNGIMKVGYIPESWKTSIIIPLYKGNNKPKEDPDSYRAVSLLPVLYKLFEKLIYGRVQQWLSETHMQFPNKQQQGFQKQKSCTTVSFNLHETLYYNLELHSKVYASFLDIRKAFDTVWQKGLMMKLQQLGIDKHLLNVINQSYTNIRSCVCINGHTSTAFEVMTGVRQGGVLSSFLYLVYINDLLNMLEADASGTSICSVYTGNPALADDLTILSLSPKGLQKQLSIVEQYALDWKFEININKSCVMTFGTKTNSSRLHMTISGKELKHIDLTEHVGIPISNKLKCDEKIEKACRKGRGSFYAIVGLEPTLNKLNPLTTASLYRKVVLPSALYGSETWTNLTQSNEQSLNVFQHKCCKTMQNLPMATRSCMCESMIGMLPIATAIHKKKLMFLQNLCSLDNDHLSKQIFLRRLYQYMNSDRKYKQLGFIPDVMGLLSLYKLFNTIELFIRTSTFPSKTQWKNTIRSAIYSREHEILKSRLNSSPDFDRFKHIHKSYSPILLWQTPSNNSELKSISCTVRILTSPPREYLRLCHRCKTYVMDLLKHVIMTCTHTESHRLRFWEHTAPLLDIGTYETLRSLPEERQLQFLIGRAAPELNVDTDIRKQLLLLSATYFSTIRIMELT